MGNRAIENRIKKLQEIEAQQKALEQEADKLKEEIKREMEAREIEEMKAGPFVIRWKLVAFFPAGRESLKSRPS